MVVIFNFVCCFFVFFWGGGGGCGDCAPETVRQSLVLVFLFFVGFCGVFRFIIWGTSVYMRIPALCVACEVGLGKVSLYIYIYRYIYRHIYIYIYIDIYIYIYIYIYIFIFIYV